MWQPCLRELCPWCILWVPHYSQSEAQHKAQHLDAMAKGGGLPPMAGFIAMHAAKWATSEMQDFPALSASSSAAAAIARETEPVRRTAPQPERGGSDSSWLGTEVPPPPPGSQRAEATWESTQVQWGGLGMTASPAYVTTEYYRTVISTDGVDTDHSQTGAHAASWPPEPRYWQFWAGKKQKWQRYSPVNQNLINAAYDADHPHVLLNCDGREYKLDFHQLVQINDWNSTHRTIRIEIEEVE